MRKQEHKEVYNLPQSHTELRDDRVWIYTWAAELLSLRSYHNVILPPVMGTRTAWRLGVQTEVVPQKESERLTLQPLLGCTFHFNGGICFRSTDKVIYTVVFAWILSSRLIDPAEMRKKIKWGSWEQIYKIYNKRIKRATRDPALQSVSLNASHLLLTKSKNLPPGITKH